MKSTIPALAILASVSGLGIAQPLSSIDLSGAEFFDGPGDSSNTILSVFIGASFSLTHIEWNLNLTTFTDPNSSTPSWASDANINFNGLLNLQVSDTTGGVVNENNVGSADVSITIGPDGMLRMELWESFDDSPDNADAALAEGSWIRINYLPAPGPIAAFGVGGLFITRRRR